MKTEQDVEQKTREDRRMDVWFHLLYLIIWPIYNILRPVRAIGRENIPSGPAVICPNHSSNRDPFHVVYAFGWRYPMRAMAKVQLMRLPFVGWILGKAGVFGVDRDKTDVKAVKTALGVLKNGNKLLMFPEGTRVRGGEDVAAKTGAAMFASRTGAPLLPVYIRQQKRAFARSVVVIGEPFYPKFSGRKPTAEELDAITQELMERVHALKEAAL